VSDKIFIDTLFVGALVSINDQYHKKATELAAAYEGQPLLVTDPCRLQPTVYCLHTTVYRSRPHLLHATYHLLFFSIASRRMCASRSNRRCLHEKCP
jgi:predicted nucleic acid-binding protein